MFVSCRGINLRVGGFHGAGLTVAPALGVPCTQLVFLYLLVQLIWYLPYEFYGCVLRKLETVPWYKFLCPSISHLYATIDVLHNRNHTYELIPGSMLHAKIEDTICNSLAYCNKLIWSLVAKVSILCVYCILSGPVNNTKMCYLYKHRCIIVYHELTPKLLWQYVTQYPDHEVHCSGIEQLGKFALQYRVLYVCEEHVAHK